MNFDEYYEKLKLSPIVVARVKEVLEIVSNILPEEIEDIFIMNRVTTSGVDEYTNLMVFTENIMSESKEFLTDIVVDYMKKNSVIYYELKARKYDFKEANAESRLSIEIMMKDRITQDIVSSSNNCDDLYRILNKHIIKSIVDS